jgi:amino acid transporter
VKPTPAQIILAYLGLAMLLLGVFHKPVGLSDAVGDSFVFVGIGCNLLCLYLYRRKRARLDGAEPASTLSPTRRRAVFWSMLALIAIISLSMPLWLPYTGTPLPFSTNVILAIVTCIISITLFIAGWRRGQRKV